MTTAIIAILLMISTFMIVLPTPVSAQQLPTEQTIGPRPAGVTDDMTVPTEIMLVCTPNPIGLGQELLVNIWTVRAPGAGRAFKGYEITITNPSGQTTEFTVDSYVADGTTWFPWIMDALGDWTFVVDFPGNFFPAGDYSAGAITHEDEPVDTNVFNYDEPVYVLPDTSEVVTVTVLPDFVPIWPASPLPTDYWTRPAASENREWWPILGDFPWFGRGGGTMWDELYPDTNTFPARSGSNFDYSFLPWIQVPNTGHIAWKRMVEIGGLIGGDEGIASDIFWSPDWNNKPTLILAGRGYEVITKPSTDGPTPETWWQCYDIRTGEIIWERPLYDGEQEPNLIEYAPSDYTLGLGVSGITGLQVKNSIPSLMVITGGRIKKYDAVYGHLILNQSIAPLTGSGGTYYRNGFCLAVQNLGSSVPVGERYRLINWTTIGSASNFQDRVISNTSYARSSLPSRVDWETGIGANVGNIDRGGVRWGQSITAYNLYTGVELWSVEVEAPQFSGSAAVADHGKIVIGSMYGYFIAYDLANGQEVWRTETMDYPWDQTGWGSYGMCSAYGMLYWGAPSAYYAFDWDTGDTVWKFRIPAEFPFETAYGTGTTAEEAETVYPFHAPGWVADGKLLVYSMHHSPEPPYFRGQPMLCINATTGDLIWKLGGFTGSGQHTKSGVQLAMADGYVVLGSRDGYLYGIGKGKSETTVSAPLTAIPKGASMTIAGTVLDMSPAQPGIPCVSKDSIEVQMQHIHLQMPIDGIHHNVTLEGVPVILSAFGSDGTYYDLGTTTTDGYYGSYGLKWTPPEEDVYRIVASFEGDDSYGSSGASTYVSVGPAVEQPSTPENPTPPDYTMTIIAAAIAVIIAVAIATVLILRKR